MKIDLLGGSYKQRYPDFNSEKTINWYPTKASSDEKNKSSTALFSTPGLTLFTKISGNYARGFYTALTASYNRCFAIVDNILYEILINGSSINRGTMSFLTIGPSTVEMTVNSLNQLGIWHQSASYCFNMNTNTLTQINTNQFVGNVSSADYIDGYTLVSSGGLAYLTLNDITTWSSTNTYSTTFTAAPIIAIRTLMEEVYNFTTRTIEPYVLDTTVNPPFSAYPRSVVQIGLVSKDSIYKFQDGFIFVGRAESGECAVYAYDKFYNCLLVSPFSVTWQLNQVQQTLAECYANGYTTKDGHVWYQLTIPSLRTTYVFDYTTKEWFERKSKQPNNDSDGSNIYKEFRGKYQTSFHGLNLWQDIYSGNIYKEDFTNFTEDSNTIIRTRISTTIDNERAMTELESLELDTNCGYGNLTGLGTSPQMMISWSNDGGYTYTDPDVIPLGVRGDHANRAKLNQLGANRLWTFKFSIADPVDSMIQNAIVHGSLGEET